MKHTPALLAALSLMPLAGLCATGSPTPANGARIDRHALVTRHNIEWNDPTGKIPLGNGEFCFTADGTGLQTFGGNAMAHWAWHSFPLPAGRTAADIPSTGTFQRGRNQGPDEFPPDKDDPAMDV